GTVPNAIPGLAGAVVSADAMPEELASGLEAEAAIDGKVRISSHGVGGHAAFPEGTDNAIGKLDRKNFDFIVLISMNDKGAGFNHDTNKITIINRSKEVKNYDLKSKVMVAKDIVDEIEKLLKP
ncbi:MAG: phosphopantothenoylcysteine decarboxylase, partial [Bacteroidales bacterium]|nr:phosphopantothenoylcysteine decarboxylase [Bacteroidales bacterium]